MLHKNYHDTACITGFVFKAKYLRGWKSKDERGEIETKKEKKLEEQFWSASKKNLRLKKYWKDKEKCFIVVKRVDNQEDTLIVALYASNSMALKHVRWEPKRLWVEVNKPGM